MGAIFNYHKRALGDGGVSSLAVCCVVHLAKVHSSNFLAVLCIGSGALNYTNYAKKDAQ